MLVNATVPAKVDSGNVLGNSRSAAETKRLRMGHRRSRTTPETRKRHAAAYRDCSRPAPTIPPARPTAKTLQARTLARLTTYAGGYDIPVLVTRAHRDDFTKPVATAADHHLEALATEISEAVEIRLEHEAHYDWVAFMPQRESDAVHRGGSAGRSRPARCDTVTGCSPRQTPKGNQSAPCRVSVGRCTRRTEPRLQATQRIRPEYAERGGVKARSRSRPRRPPRTGYRVRGRRRREILTEPCRPRPRSDRDLRRRVLRDPARQSCRKRAVPPQVGSDRYPTRT